MLLNFMNLIKLPPIPNHRYIRLSTTDESGRPKREITNTHSWPQMKQIIASPQMKLKIRYFFRITIIQFIQKREFMGPFTKKSGHGVEICSCVFIPQQSVYGYIPPSYQAKVFKLFCHINAFSYEALHQGVI